MRHRYAIEVCSGGPALTFGLSRESDRSVMRTCTWRLGRHPGPSPNPDGPTKVSGQLQAGRRG